jgi:light-regulated signal transduction histidine kinase (bacteriophytochrome)
MPQIVWTASPEGHLDYFNQRWYEFSASAENPSANSSFVSLLRAEDALRWQADWQTAIRDGGTFRAEYQFWDQEGQCWRWFMGRAVPIRNETGTILKWIGSWTDIDEQKRSEDELRRANQDLEQFAYSASHDLQEPLRTVQLYGEILATRFADALPEKGREYMGFVRAGAARMETLVNDLLSYTQLARLESPAAQIDTNEEAAMAVGALAGTIEETGAKVIIEPLPPVNVHAAHLQQLFQNLIGNALKYRSKERGPVIRVSARRARDEWEFAVSDNGIGIDAQYKEKIFGLFKRLHTSDEYPGTGIGLAICQRIVERYHGRIWVESRLGEGSTFYFTLPG